LAAAQKGDWRWELAGAADYRSAALEPAVPELPELPAKMMAAAALAAPAGALRDRRHSMFQQPIEATTAWIRMKR
jgi:hypothetical protein